MRKYLILLLIIVFTGSILFMGISCGNGGAPVVEEVVEEEEIVLTEEVIEEKQPEISLDNDQFFELLENNTLSGGPGKDGIPAVGSPEYTTLEEGDGWLLPEDIVFGIEYDGLVAAYPQRILVWHEIVNETLGDKDITISYCPLTGTAIGFLGNLAQDIQSTFGVSGKLVNSNLIMYDRATDSYWPQILGTAINGISKGFKLVEFPVTWTTWEKWKTAHPETKVLSRETGFIRNYDVGGDPYGSYVPEPQRYYISDQILFRPVNEDDRLSPKAVVVGIRDEERNASAILKDYLREKKNVEVELGGKTILVNYDEKLDFYSAQIKETGEWINAFDAMWFSWVAYYPQTELIK
jgi:hypothetical protein